MIPDRQRKASFECEGSSTVETCVSHVDDTSSQSSTLASETPVSPRKHHIRDLVTDYGCQIDAYLRKIEKDS